MCVTHKISAGQNSIQIYSIRGSYLEKELRSKWKLHLCHSDKLLDRKPHGLRMHLPRPNSIGRDFERLSFQDSVPLTGSDSKVSIYKGENLYSYFNFCSCGWCLNLIFLSLGFWAKRYLLYFKWETDPAIYRLPPFVVEWSLVNGLWICG